MESEIVYYMSERPDILIRVARVEDAEDLLNIYAYYVKNTAISFEHEVPSLEEFKGRIKETLKNYPYLVAEIDGKIIGYVYANRFRTRAAFSWCAATSIYINMDYRRLGIGRILYEELEKILVKQNLINLYAAVANPSEEDEYLTRNSEHFHEKMGYKTVAKFQKSTSNLLKCIS